jgi:hypothetical protein
VTQKADPLRRKALARIREDRVRVRVVETDAPDSGEPHWVLAVVRSSRDGHPYRVEYVSRVWSCDCREGRRALPCAHTLAVALVTTGVGA